MLFNKLCGRRLSIVEDTPGVTRDRLYAECEWCGRTFDIVDTGGIEPAADTEILEFMREQAQIAIEAADVIVLVTDLRTGVTAADKDVANLLKRSHKPVVLAVNKADSTGAPDPGLYEFYELGLGDPIAVSAIHGHGTGDLLDECLKSFPPQDEEEREDDAVKVAVIGKPNVGKSSLINTILGEKRVIVSDVAGTTRDAVDTPFENKSGKYVFIDTAGIRRQSRVEERVEKFSVMTTGDQRAETDFSVDLDGEDSSANVVSRSVAKDTSRQVFRSIINGNNKCAGHTECDAIIMSVNSFAPLGSITPVTKPVIGWLSSSDTSKP